MLRLLLLVGFLAFSQCEEERVIRIRVDQQDVYRNALYTENKQAKVFCLPPKETNDRYEELAIYVGNATKDDKPVCKVQNNAPSSGCFLTTGTEPSLSIVINNNNEKPSIRYICKYDKAPEPPVKEAEVTVYFKNQDIKAFNDDGVQVDKSQLRLTNDSTYRLVCPGANQPDATVHWYRNEHELKFDHGNAHYELNETTHDLTFKKSKNQDSSKFGGWYRCEVVPKNGGPITNSFIKISSPAYVSAASKSYNKMEGESATLSCEVDGEPVPAVQWRRGDKAIDANPDDKKRITFSSYRGIPGASVTISNLVAEDYGDYTCVADGRDGSHAEAVVLLRVRSKLAALWPFLGIVAEVVVLVAIIFIYERRRAKKEQEENEDAADQKKSLTASNNENKDVRQRKA